MLLKDHCYYYYYFNWRRVALQGCVGFCRTTTQIIHQCIYTYISLPLQPPVFSLPLTHPHFTPLGHHRALDWAPCVYSRFPLPVSVLYIVMYICQCYSFNSSHPLLPSLCPQDCPLCLCLYSYPAYMIINTVFLVSICML